MDRDIDPTERSPRRDVAHPRSRRLVRAALAAELGLLHACLALPSGGLSGAVMIAQALRHRGMTGAAAIAVGEDAVVEWLNHHD